MKSLKILSVSLSLLALLFAQGCRQDGCTDPTAINYNPDATESTDCTFPSLMLHFHPVVGDEDLTLGETYEINGVKARIDLASFYVSGISVGADGEFDENPDTYLLVKADQMMYDVGQITAGHKHMLRFRLGIDSLTNHADPTQYEDSNPLALQSPSMHWNWDAGYRFLNIGGEVDTDGDGEVDSLLEYHIGKDAFARMVMLEAHKEADSEQVMIDLQVDFAKLFEDIDLATQPISHTFDVPEVATKLMDNFVTAITVTK
ncbi:MAG: MbnP family protein [Bacteroidota bacterium]